MHIRTQIIGYEGKPVRPLDHNGSRFKLLFITFDHLSCKQAQHKIRIIVSQLKRVDKKTAFCGQTHF